MIRHRSTANWRATATMAFLRAAPVASAPRGCGARICRHLRTALQSRWKRTSRHANSTSAALSLGLPCLVTQLCKRVLPLLYSPGHQPGRFLFFAGHAHDRQRGRDCLAQSGPTSGRAPWHPAHRSLPAGCAQPTSAGRPRGNESPGQQVAAAGKNQTRTLPRARALARRRASA